MRIRVDQDECCATRTCSYAAPEVFGHETDGRVLVLLTSPPAELEEKAREAAELCPFDVIEILED